MTRRVGNIVIIEDEPDRICVRCKKITDTRDVLGDGTRLCLDCASPAECEAYANRLFDTELS